MPRWISPRANQGMEAGGYLLLGAVFVNVRPKATASFFLALLTPARLAALGV